MGIYLDSAATTKMSSAVLDAMMPYLTEEFGNAGTLYKLGRNAADAVSKAREQVAALFNCTPEHVIFTSGGSESNNTVFKGVKDRLIAEHKTHLVISAIEHESVLKAAESLTKDGFYITYVYPTSDGITTPEAVSEALREDTGLVSVMYMNNETGSINDIFEIGNICREKSVLFHTDCVQAAGVCRIDTENVPIDFASVSSHKIRGPKGIGALYIRDQALIEPLVYGGDVQEFGVRGGTENVPGIVGFGKACEIALKDFDTLNSNMTDVKYCFIETLYKELEKRGVDKSDIAINGGDICNYKIVNFRVNGLDAQTLILVLSSDNIYVSAGSACQSHENKPSHVLMAMGLTEEEARSSVRVSFSRYDTVRLIEYATEIIARRITELLKCNRNGVND